MTETIENKEIPKDFMAIVVWHEFFYSKQREFVKSPAWQTFFVAANGTGKTLIFYWNVVAHLMGLHPYPFAKPPLTARIIVPSFDNVEDTALVKLLDPQDIVQHGKVVVPREDIGSLLPKSFIKKKGSYNKEHRGIDLINGSKIVWVTEIQGWSLMRGPEQDILGMDEECSERVFDENLRGMRNSKNGGKVYGALTPPYEEGHGPTWTKEKIVDASVGNSDIKVVQACMADNPAIDELFIKRFSRGKTKEQIDVQVYGSYPNWGKTIHYPFQNRYWDKDKIEGNILPIDTPMPEYWEANWYMAFDWHPSKPCAAVWAWEDSDGNIVVFDELAKDLAENKEIMDLVEIFKQIEGNNRGRKWMRWQDPSAKSKYKALNAGFNAWDEFRKHGIVTAEGRNRDPELGISIVNDYLKGDCKSHPRLFIRENCEWTRRYIENHYWKRVSTDVQGKPDPKWSDYPICIRYFVQEIGMKWRDKGTRRKWPLTSYGGEESDKQVIDLGRWV